MKRHVFWLISLTILAGLSVQTQAAEHQSYPLFCKGSKAMKLELYPGRDSVHVNLSFKKGTRAVSQGLNGGECTWSDRGMSQAEPAMLMFEVEGVYLSMTVGPGDAVAMKVQGIVSGGDARADALERILNAVRSGREFQVHVYNNKRGALQVTKLGP